MYDYVLQYGFDHESQHYIQSIKDHLKTHGIKDKKRNWLPHITIDLYDCNNQQEFLDTLDTVVAKISRFTVEFKNLNHYNGETLYIEPYQKETLMELKQYFNITLSTYMLEKRRNRTYIPHATLCTSDALDQSITLAKQIFHPFVAKIDYLWVYDHDMNLIKSYSLKENL